MKRLSAIILLSLTVFVGCARTFPDRIFSSIERGQSLYFAPDVIAYCADHVEMTVVQTNPRCFSITITNAGPRSVPFRPDNVCYLAHFPDGTWEPLGQIFFRQLVEDVPQTVLKAGGTLLLSSGQCGLPAGSRDDLIRVGAYYYTDEGVVVCHSGLVRYLWPSAEAAADRPSENGLEWGGRGTEPAGNGGE